MTQRTEAMRTVDSEACGGLSIRDALFGFLVQTCGELLIHEMRPGKKSKKRIARLLGQQEALAYAVALIDNPYRVDFESVLATARVEAEK